MKKQKILVAGGNGQLGSCLKKIAADYEERFEFIFTDSSEMDITVKSEVEDIFDDFKPAYCINASAYTAVDLAEQEKDKAFLVNAEGVGNLAEVCSEFKTVFIHISTDYVFDGETNLSYSEDDFTNPLGVYGASKLQGEELALENCTQTIILRTSWLYSEFNKNFVKTMLNLFKTKPELGVVADQFGQPTNANDLAEAIMEIISNQNKKFGVYHFSNEPETSWYSFAAKIAEFSGSSVHIKPISTEQFPTPAKRPTRSTMCLDKIQEDFGIEPKNWENSLQECLQTLKEAEHV